LHNSVIYRPSTPKINEQQREPFANGRMKQDCRCPDPLCTRILRFPAKPLQQQLGFREGFLSAAQRIGAACLAMRKPFEGRGCATLRTLVLPSVPPVAKTVECEFTLGTPGALSSRSIHRLPGVNPSFEEPRAYRTRGAFACEGVSSMVTKAKKIPIPTCKRPRFATTQRPQSLVLLPHVRFLTSSRRFASAVGALRTGLPWGAW
jgi:hypothetical protein